MPAALAAVMQVWTEESNGLSPSLAGSAGVAVGKIVSAAFE
jgi:hypothetical protein